MDNYTTCRCTRLGKTRTVESRPVPMPKPQTLGELASKERGLVAGFRWERHATFCTRCHTEVR